MPFLAAVLNTMGLVFLTHAIYSTHEHHSLTASSPYKTSTTAIPSFPSIPLDILIELLASTLALLTGIVLSSPALKPIQWSTWSSSLSRSGRKSEGKYTKENIEVLGEGDPFQFLGLDSVREGEGRRGFWDGRGARGEYVGWVKAGGKA
ncbi:hypothetical protein GQ43DRAFT_439257 [Delitschia confertaspora ATCC 74209]|uniref:Magnesium transporter n=1 Tax=Delitschia confertaspora ATCC 74209 TaxID=1513339 RepID=A0A9P4MX94_9PLEO|nr:hypothetical protein GQ43DRAFT_439257 [Delitschia confertaspora ATCC 74209]